MNVLIIEDEISSRNHLTALLESSPYPVKVVGTGASVQEAMQLLRQGEGIDLVFLDIHLSDGSAFEIFRNLKVDTPIIFTTAYDRYVLDAFAVNSIAYLLKPITQAALDEAIQKHISVVGHHLQAWQIRLENLIKSVSVPAERNLKKRFLVKVGIKFTPIEIDRIACFYRDNIVYLFTLEGEKYPINESLDILESQLDPDEFIRLNRQVLVRKSFIVNLEQYTSSKLLVTFRIPLPFEVVVSQEKASWVKENLDR